MILTAFVLNGQPISSYSSYSSEAVGNNILYKAEDTVSPGYQDISSITNWYIYGEKTGADYKNIRKAIQILAATITWANLTLEEKKICSIMFAVAKVYRDDVHTFDEQISYGTVFHHKSVESRQLRANRAIAEIFSRLEPSEYNVILDDIMGADPLFSTYINFGREGTEEGDVDGAFDYMNGRANTKYTGKGLVNYSFVPQGLNNMDDLAALLMNILKHGKY